MLKVAFIDSRARASVIQQNANRKEKKNELIDKN